MDEEITTYETDYDSVDEETSYESEWSDYVSTCDSSDCPTCGYPN